MWKIVNDALFRKTRDPMKSLYNRFDGLDTPADIINRKLTEDFSNKLAVPLIIFVFNLSEMTITEQQVYNLLRILPNHKSSPDVPIKLYKAAASILASPLASIFMESFEKAIVNMWKISAVIPLPKSHSTTSTDEIRTISLLPPRTKILEGIILKFAKMHFLQAYGNNHFGFRLRSSTTCAMISLHDYIKKCHTTSRRSNLFPMTFLMLLIDFGVM